MDEVLEMIADAVSTLVLAVRDSEINNTLFGDMYPAAELISTGVEGMAEAAEQSIGQIHDDFTADLQNTTAQLRNACTALLNAAQQGRQRPTDRVPQKDAIRAAKTVLEKVVHLVMIEDQSNIKSLVMIGKQTGEETTRLNEVTLPTHIPTLQRDIKILQDEFIKRTEGRISGSKNIEIVGKMRDAITAIQKSAPMHFKAVSASVANPNDEPAKNQKLEESKNICNSIDEVIVLVRRMFATNAQFVQASFTWEPIRTIAEDAVLRHTMNMNNLLTTLPKYAQTGQGAIAARAVVVEANKAIESGIAVASKCEDPQKHAIIMANVAHLKKLAPTCIAAMKPVMMNPGDLEALRQLDELIKSTQAASNALNAAVALSPAQAVAASATQAHAAFETLQAAVVKKDVGAIKTGVATVVDNLDRHIAVLEAWANTIDDPERKKAVLTTVENLKKLRGEIEGASKALLVNPNDAAAAKKLTDLMNQARQAINNNVDSHEAVAANGNQLLADLDALLQSIERAGPYLGQEGVAHAKDIANDIRRQIEAAEAYASTISDPVRKQQILQSIERAKQLSPKLIEAIRAVLANPNDAAAKQRLMDLINETKAVSATLTKVAQPTAEEVQAARVARAEAFRAMEEAKRKKMAQTASTTNNGASPLTAKRLTVTGPVNKAVFIAAQQLEDEVVAKPHDNTPLGKLVSSSHNIAEEMAKLSAFAAQGNVKEMITSARAIATKIADVMAQAKAIAAECTDPRLKADVLAMAQATATWSTQLKIISAVKAASDVPDPTTEEQLITCAQGLADAVARAVRAAEVASIRTKAPAPRKK